MIQSQVLIKDKKQQQDPLICIVIYCQNFSFVFSCQFCLMSVYSPYPLFTSTCHSQSC